MGGSVPLVNNKGIIMIFNSYIFILFFLPLTVMGYYIVNKYCSKKNGQAGLIWLSVMSVIFYAYDIPIYLLLLVGSILVNFVICRAITSWRRKQGNEKLLKGLMVLGILVNLAPLLYFKYWNFLVYSLEDFLGPEWNIEVALPLGISFFTFMQIAYVVDCYSKKDEFNYTFLEYATYVLFYPKITMGPIALHSEIIPQFRDDSKKRINYQNMSYGLYTFALGLGKKVLLADTLAKIVSIGYEQYRFINSMTAAMVMLCYTLQLYFDFSGYCDMAVGISKMLNIDLPYNFNSPYKARSISEFWDRWHMTLTRFFTRYIYIPLGGSRKGKFKTYRNTIIVFLLSGLWHGAEWSFVFWGLLHGIMMVIEKIGKDIGIGCKKINGVAKKICGFAKWLITFGIINITWVFFRAEDMEHAIVFLQRLCGGGWEYHPQIIEIFAELIEVRILKRFGLGNIIDGNEGLAIWLCLGILVMNVVFSKNTQEKMLLNKYHWVRSIVTTILIVWCVISLSDVSVFLYFNF